jgi:class 3 adenylate cyclase/tetratricopeptide (TPR) repeat protein
MPNHGRREFRDACLGVGKMRCPSCNSENPDTTRFCGSCGRPLTKRCGKCGTENPPQFKFCGECGSALIDAAASGVVVDKAKRDRASDGVPAVPNRREGERRHLTVLFCDLVGSTEIAAQLDPEDWRETVAGYQRAAADAITRFDGHVAKYLGDGVMAFFGYPEAHDNDAERASRAGLAILDAIAKLNEQSGCRKLSARVGIDSGAVVVGAGAGKDADVFGDAPNIAARVQAAAEPGVVLITDTVHRLISGLFVVEDRGAQALKGIERPIQLYRVIQPSGVRGRLEAVAAARGLTPFVGREDELRLLMNRWERVLEGEGQVVTIIGEAGIGKSRLVQHFRGQIAATSHTWLECATDAFLQNTPFYAIVEMLRQSLLWEQRFRALGSSLGSTANERTQPAPLIASLLAPPVNSNSAASSMPPEQQRKQLLAALVAWTFEIAKAQPLVIATEDLHWADPSTLELIQLLVEQGATARLMLLYTARPEFRAAWPLRAHHTQINLNRLSTRNVRMMVGQVAARKALSDETVAAVVERTSGVPLFVEELTRVVLETGNEKLIGREIPVTLHDSLMARLDRLGPAKEVAQVGAVIGGEFSYELIRAVHPIAETDLEEALRTMADRDLLYVRGIAPEAIYQFKHALIRDAAYEALLKSRRKELHRQVAHTIEEKFPALNLAHPEVLARHWTEADEPEHAIAEWERASKAAEMRGGFQEALESCQRALEMLSLIPESPERDLRELRLTERVLLGLWMIRGPSSNDTMGAMQRATALAEKGGELASLVILMVTAGMSALFASGDMTALLTLADQALELAVREGGPGSLLFAHSFQMQVRLFRSDLAGAEKHFAAEMERADDHTVRRNYGTLLVQDLGWGAMNAWLRGLPDLARQRFAEMIAITSANNPYELAMSQLLAADLQFALREYKQAEAFATHALELSEKHQFALLAAISKCSLGKVLAQLGRATEGVELLSRGIAGALEIGMRPSATGWLAMAQAAGGAIVEALDTVDQALQQNMDAPLYLPGTFLLRGELRMKQGQSELAEADFREALARARSMGAKALELLATMSLARLLAKEGKRDEGHSMLADIYGWFTEGFDTADLKDAKALLDQLNG